MRRNRSPRLIHVFADGVIRFGPHRARCALGRTGIVGTKREGDGGTPVGLFPLRDVRFRPDVGRPQTLLTCRPILRTHGWCDDPGHALYNRPVRLPFAAGHEKLRRPDRHYDLVITIGQNDRPARPGMGSAIFVHVISEQENTTEGCVALHPSAILRLLNWARAGDLLKVHPPGRLSGGL